ncbi:MAG: hypothetical protein WC764_01070 [Candidatus Paceibacterota bacterium]|jgi:cell division protein FtsB
MRDFQAKRQIKRILYSKVTIGALVVLNLLILKSDIQLYGKERYTASNEAQARQEYNDILAREKSLSADVARLSTSEGVDLELRRKFSVVKPGEEAVVIVKTAATATPEKLEQKSSFWQNVTSFFGF